MPVLVPSRVLVLNLLLLSKNIFLPVLLLICMINVSH